MSCCLGPLKHSFDSLIFPGLRAEIRGTPGSEPTSGTLGPGGCAAILGAGNVQSIPAKIVVSEKTDWSNIFGGIFGSKE